MKVRIFLFTLFMNFFLLSCGKTRIYYPLAGVTSPGDRVTEETPTPTPVSGTISYGLATRVSTLQTFALTPTVSGNMENIVYSATNLPTGLSLNATTGEITGSPTAGATFNLIVTATADSGYVTTYSKTIEVLSNAYVVNDQGDAGAGANTTDDTCETVTGNGICTLRAAIEESSGMVAARTVLIPDGYTITLTNGPIIMDTSITLYSTEKTLDSVNLHASAGNRLFEVTNAGSTFTLEYITLQDGQRNYAGAIFVAANCHISTRYVVFKNNQSISGSPGGAVYLPAGNGVATFQFTKFINNTATDFGGAVAVRANTTLNISDSVFSGNSATGNGGAIFTQGITNTIERTLISNTTGGASVIEVSLVGNTTTLRNVTIEGSTTYQGIVQNSAASFNIINCTFANNTSSADGGGFLRSNGGAIEMTNTILYNNIDNSGPLDHCMVGGTGSFVSNNNNLMDGNDATCQFDTVTKNDQENADPLLGALADNGGFSQTMDIGITSPAHDAGSAANCPAVDQRGETRIAAECDIGAYEKQ
jgi:predicted outer membrane repeat protein